MRIRYSLGIRPAVYRLMLATSVIAAVGLWWTPVPPRGAPLRLISMMLALNVAWALWMWRKFAVTVEADAGGLRWQTPFGAHSARIDQLARVRPAFVAYQRFELTDGRTFIVTPRRGFLPFAEALRGLAPTLQMELLPALARIEAARFSPLGKFERW